MKTSQLPQSNQLPKVSRRSFLKVGVIGAVTLAVAGSLYRFTTPANPAGKFILDGEANAVLVASRCCCGLLWLSRNQS